MQMGLTILLVDDDQMLTEKTKNSLDWDSLGISMVFTAGNIHEAKGILKVFKVDILLCDVDMPMGSGLELVEWIRNSQMGMKCIVLSSYANFTDAQKALRLGSDNQLLKPISKKELEAELKKIDTAINMIKNMPDQSEMIMMFTRTKIDRNAILNNLNKEIEDLRIRVKLAAKAEVIAETMAYQGTIISIDGIILKLDNDYEKISFIRKKDKILTKLYQEDDN